MPHPFRIYNTLSRQIEDFQPQVEGKVGLYVCGMTVYDDIHIGHGRAMVVFDAFARYLRHRGWALNFVRNFTDVDDKIIARAKKKDCDPFDYAQQFIDRFHEDVGALGLAMPDREPRVTETIELIVEMIEGLIAKGHAYKSEASVWFAVESYDGYGRLSNRKLKDMLSADEQAGKRHSGDFALWKNAKVGEPAWDSPWGRGRPGWHIECSAMSLDTLGATVDIHGGGLDLVFPHHENEIAQSVCANSHDYVRYWMHNGLLNMAEGHKMSKSLGNVINIRDALADFPAEALRLYYLQNQYRSPLTWGNDALPQALAMLARLYDAREKAEEWGGAEPLEQVVRDLGADAQALVELTTTFDQRFYAALDEDFNTPLALGVVFEIARSLNRLSNHKKAKKCAGPLASLALSSFEKTAAALGLLGMPTADFQEEVKAKRLATLGLTRAAVDAKLEERRQARRDKNWALSDQIRDDLEAQGVIVMDTAEGANWRLSLGGGEGS